MGDAEATGQRLVVQRGLQFADLAHPTAAFELALFIQQRHTGAVVAAVFQAFQAFHQHGGDVAFGDGAYNATHSLLLRSYSKSAARRPCCVKNRLGMLIYTSKLRFLACFRLAWL
ncbi:hypothetical protein D3C72_2116710 [compost metagenome]